MELDEGRYLEGVASLFRREERKNNKSLHDKREEQDLRGVSSLFKRAERKYDKSLQDKRKRRESRELKELYYLAVELGVLRMISFEDLRADSLLVSSIDYKVSKASEIKRLVYASDCYSWRRYDEVWFLRLWDYCRSFLKLNEYVNVMYPLFRIGNAISSRESFDEFKELLLKVYHILRRSNDIEPVQNVCLRYVLYSN